jgi:hypothetical protein
MSLFVTFSTLKEGEQFLFDVAGRTRKFIRRNGTSFENGPNKPIDYNCLDLGDRSGWVFEDTDRVVKV